MPPNNFNATDVVPYITRIPARPAQRDVDQDVDLRATRDLGQGSHVRREDPNAVDFHADSSYLGYGAYATLDGSRVDTSEYADPDWAGANLEPERPATPAAPRDHTGRGPRGYRRSDARIHDEICDRLLHDEFIDASEIEVSVLEGDVLLLGTVEHRDLKHLAEDVAFRVSGVLDVTNQLRVGPLGVTRTPDPDPAQDISPGPEEAEEDAPAGDRWAHLAHGSLVDRGGEDDEDLHDPGDLSAQARRARERRDLREHDYQGPRDTSRSERLGKI
jgi:hypothetical protein